MTRDSNHINWRGTTWTPEREEELARLWNLGWTASEIARELRGVTRNAVIGKASRMGLQGRPSPIPHNPNGARAKARKRSQARGRSGRAVQTTLGYDRQGNNAVVVPEVPIEAPATQVLAAPVRGCQFIIIDWVDNRHLRALQRQDPAQIHCGRALHIGSYCKEHFQRCHTRLGIKSLLDLEKAAA